MSRLEVLDVAEKLFGENGYDRTSLDQVALGSGYSVGSIYLYFKSKSALLSAVMERRVREQARLVRDCLNQYRSGWDQLQAMALISMNFFQTHPAYGQLSLTIYGTRVEALPDFEDYSEGYKTWTRALATAIGNGQTDGTMRDGDPIWLAQLVSSLIVSHVSLVFAGQQLSVEDVLPVIAGAVSKSSTRPPRVRAPRST